MFSLPADPAIGLLLYYMQIRVLHRSHGYHNMPSIYLLLMLINKYLGFCQNNPLISVVENKCIYCEYPDIPKLDHFIPYLHVLFDSDVLFCNHVSREDICVAFVLPVLTEFV